MNISFDAYESESQYYVIAKKWVQLLLTKGLASQTYKDTYYFGSFVKNLIYFFLSSQNGTIQVQFNTTLKNKPHVIKYVVQKSDGTTLYITRLV